MNIDEKLKHFYDSVMDDSREQASAILEAHQQKLNGMFEKHAEQQRLTAQTEITAETEHAQREMNKALFNEQLSLKRSLNEKQEELTGKLFAETEELLHTFMRSPEYESFLEKKIRQAQAFAENDEFTVFLSPEDEKLGDTLSKHTGCELKIAEESFLGGIRTEIPSRNILIDDSFRSALDALRKNFKFDGGTRA